LPLVDCYYDQHWAMGALLGLDDRLGTRHADGFLAPGGLWEQSVMRRLDPYERQAHISRLCAFADEGMRSAS
jgi:hypothetical protein